MSSKPSPSCIHIAALTLLCMAGQASGGNATWKAVPASEDWNTATNWIPESVPNGPADVATFASSTDPNPFIYNATEVSEVVFSPGASAFTITVTDLSEPLTISGIGVTNNSGITQNFATVHEVMNQGGGEVVFQNSAKAGIATVYTIGKDAHFNIGSALTDMYFNDDSSADQASLIVISSALYFTDRSTAEDANITCTQGIYPGGELWFDDQSTAANARIVIEGATSSDSSAGNANFEGSATAANGTLIVNRGSNGGRGGFIVFYADSTAGDSSIVVHGGSGVAAGTILFVEGSSGGSARIALFDDGSLQILHHDESPSVTIGSLEGNGQVLLKAYTLAVGSNDLNRTFSGQIQDGGGGSNGRGMLRKIGRGTLTLGGANTYTGGTAISRGVLIATNVDGSATGSGPVEITGGALGGNGIIAGTVTVGRGDRAAFLTPGSGSSLGTLTIQSPLLFNSAASYQVELDSNSVTADRVVAKGVTISSGTTITIADLGAGTLSDGIAFTLIDNTADTPITGNFDNLLDGSILGIGSNTFEVDYEGGDGNDLTLTVLQ